MLQVFHGIAGKTCASTINATQSDEMDRAIDVVATAATMTTDAVIVEERSEDEQNVTVL